jgi:hypothetical protein
MYEADPGLIDGVGSDIIQLAGIRIEALGQGTATGCHNFSSVWSSSLLFNRSLGVYSVTTTSLAFALALALWGCLDRLAAIVLSLSSHYYQHKQQHITTTMSPLPDFLLDVARNPVLAGMSPILYGWN